ncbi:MAG: response regulator [Chloroflexi bacterium]|nr:response regulator [Chloroflexota bacterium]
MTGRQAVLVVDDSPTIRKVIQLTLQREGLRVVTAGDALTALAALADEQPALVLLDVVLPRMDGFHVCHTIRSHPRCQHVPVILLTGKNGFFDRVRGKLAGSTAYLTKPFDPQQLLTVVRKHLPRA